MAECKVCQKPLNQEASEISPWCLDCIKDMVSTSTSNIEARLKGFKKERILIIVFGAIGSLIGLAALSGDMPANFKFACFWCGIGGGAGFGWFISAFVSFFKGSMRDGDSFGGAIKNAFWGGIGCIILGLLTGIGFVLFTVLRRISWEKKTKEIIAFEEDTLKSLENYFSSSQGSGNKTDLNKNVCQIADIYELTHMGVSTRIVQQLLKQYKVE